MFALLLVLIAMVLAGLAPRLMAQLVSFRRAPRAALVAWQAVSLAAVLAALSAAPAAIPHLTQLETRRWVVLGVAAAATLLVLGRLLLSGHRIGTRLRAAAGWLAERVSGQANNLGQAAGQVAGYAPYGLGLLAALALLLTWRQRQGRQVPGA